jgi:lipoprotein-anchoring transpeptidase ErfK/SrfK
MKLRALPNRRQTIVALIAAIVLTAIAPDTVAARDTVAFSGYSPGTIVVMTNERQLYYVLGQGRALRYPVGVGRAGMAWQGRAYVERKLIRPSWGPPADIARTNPNIPYYIPGGSPNNPMGAAVLGLNRGNYAIHGTNNPGSIGHFVSHGCIRMHNEDIMDLYRRVSVGTEVVVRP